MLRLQLEAFVKELGKRTGTYGTDHFTAQQWRGRPTAFPQLPEGHYVACGYDQGVGENIFLCDTLEDMQALYDAYSRGGALRITWYTGHEEIGTISVLERDQLK